VQQEQEEAKKKKQNRKRKEVEKDPKKKQKKRDRYGVPCLFTTTKYPKHDRPEMKPRQVKPPDRNGPRHSFTITPKLNNKCNPFSVRWDTTECQNEGSVLFMKQKLRLWGCPSQRARQLNRLTERMEGGESGSRQSATLKFDTGRAL